MPRTKSQIAAVRAHEARLLSAGGSIIKNLSLSAEATQRLAELAAIQGSRTRAIEWLILQSNINRDQG